MTIQFRAALHGGHSISSHQVARKRAWNWSGALSLFIMIAALAVWSTEASAYERYKNANEDPGSNCSACHGDFTSDVSPKGNTIPSGNKHEMHRASSNMNTECNLCHTNGDGRNPFMGSSQGTNNNVGRGCAGCHGRNEDAGNDGISAGRGAGLRQHHTTAGISTCTGCHSDAVLTNYTPVGEDVVPQYYGTADTLANEPCNAVAQSGLNENWTIGDFEGSDNDGDLLYDNNDPDCSANQPPTSDPNGPYNGTVGVSVNFDGSGSSDPEGGVLTYAWDFGDGGTGTGETTTYIYSLADVFTVTLTVTDDGGLTDTATTTATIDPEPNEAPVANPDAYATDEDTLLNVPAPGVLGNDSDADGDLLTAVLNTTTSNGTLVLNPAGGFTYTPNANFFGSDSFSYHANDGQADSNIATVSITVNDVNDPPVANAGGPYTGDEGVPVTFDGAGSTDIDGTIASYAWDFGDGGTGTGVAPTHTYAAAGTYTVTLTVADDDAATDSDTATATIAEVNVAPVANNDAYATDEDTLLNVAAPGVLANDTDADGDLLTAVLNTTTSNGTLVLNPAGGFTYTPNANFFGSDSFSYHANDGQADSNIATVSITVNDVNDPPVANAGGPYTGDEGVPVTFDGAGSTDIDGTIASYAWDFGDGGTGTGVAPTHTYAAAGTYTVTLTVADDDAATDSDTATATIAEVNVAPVANNDAYATDEDTLLNVPAPGVLGNDSDADGDLLTAVLNTTTSNGTLVLNPAGGFTYTPNANFFGADSFTYVANDGQADSNIATVSITVNDVNDPPVANAGGPYTGDEGVPVSFDGSGSTDIDGTIASYAWDFGDGGTGTGVAPTHTYAAAGTYTVTLTVADDDAATDSDTATATIAEVNVAPVANNDAYATDEDTLLNVPAPGVLGNDSDADGDLLTAVLNTTTSNGTLVLNPAGGFTYTPNANFFGSDSFSYHANDGQADSNIATVSITVNDVNDPPVANAGGPYTGDEGVPVSFDGSGSTDIDGTIASYAWDFGDGGTGTGVAPTHTYAAAGTYTVTLTVTDDDGATDSDTSSADIAEVNEAPVANNDAYNTDEDTPLNVAAPGVLANDTDADGDALTAALLAGPANGTLTLNGDGSFSYTPSANFNGADSFTYVANDGQADSNVATVSITVNDVNDAPVADANGPYTGSEGVPVSFDGSGSTDVDGTIVAYAWDFGDGGTGTGATPTHTYAVAGLYTVTLTVTDDDGATDSDTSSADIAEVNEAPVAADDAYVTDEDVILNVAAPGVLANDTDADGDALTAALVAGPANGTLTLNGDGSFSYTPSANFNGADSFTYVANDGQADSNVATVSITVNDVNDAPVADANGPYTGSEGVAVSFDGSGSTDVDGTIVAYAWDFGDGGTGTGVAPTHTYAVAGLYTVTLTVTDDDGATDSDTSSADIAEVNEAPVAADDAYATDEDVILNVAAPGVLANDTDADGDALTAALVAGPANGTLTLNGDGSFSYTPSANFNGADSFTYVANDGQADSNVATVSITVNDVNDAPVADANGPYTGSEGVAVSFDGSGSTDVDGTIVAYAWDFGDGGTGTGATPTHTYAVAGLYTVTLTVTDDDGATDSDTSSADIAEVNEAPVAADDAYVTDEDVILNVAAPGVLANDTDADGDALTAALVAGPANGTLTLNGDGSFSYTPSANFNGADSFTYVANDGQADSNVATVSITVNDVNDAPVADANGPYTGSEGVAVSFDGSGSTDVDGTIVAYAWDFGDGGTGTGATPTHTYAVAGLYTVTLTVTDDDGATDSDTSSADIAEVNEAPVAADDAYVTDEDVILNVAAPGVLANDTDADGDALTAALVAGPANGTLTLNGDGSFSYTPSANFNGADSFTYVANDGQADSNVATVSITVNDVNDAPVADANGPYTGSEGVAVSFDGSGSTDVDGTIVAYAWDFGDGGTGTGVAPTHTYAVAGLYTVTLTVTDDDGATDTASTTATIAEAAALDLDIAQFKVSKQVKLATGNGVKITLTVRNGGIVNSQTRPATVIGMQNGIAVYTRIMDVSDAVGDGRSRFVFPVFTPAATGTIMWTATIADDDPDDDTATAQTNVR